MAENYSKLDVDIDKDMRDLVPFFWEAMYTLRLTLRI